jgi:hypothetical protein
VLADTLPLLIAYIDRDLRYRFANAITAPNGGWTRRR